MKSYRIYTERKNLNFICQIVSEHFTGFTIYKTMGFWQGKPEKSVVIEIISDMASAVAIHYIRLICYKIKGYNQQTEVMYIKSEIEMEAVT